MITSPFGFLYVDGGDFLIQKPTPYYTNWCSLKISTSVLHYQVRVGSGTSRIVSDDFPFPSDDYSDINTYVDDLKGRLL